MIADPEHSVEAAVELVTLEEILRRHVMRVFAACGHNYTRAARILDVDRKTVSRMLRRRGVTEKP
jgi:ActR/RegA family two-component response regulator